MTRDSKGAALRLGIITESYAPLNTSAAVQLATLAEALKAEGHDPVVIVPSSEHGAKVVYERNDSSLVIRLGVRVRTGDGYLRRIFYEMMMPFAMRRRWADIRTSEHLDGIIWYSPSIFHGIFARYLKTLYGRPAYLILRDLFPDWAVDIGLMSRHNPAYWFLKLVERYQYRTADVIAVQSPGNLQRMSSWMAKDRRDVEVLHNWHAAPVPDPKCSIDLSASRLAGRKLFVYAGNIGVAQNMELLVDLAQALLDREDVGFVFVGRGSKFADIAKRVRDRRLENVEIFDEIPSSEITGLYAQCDFGIVSLHPDHESHNIPGKFVSYVVHELPVLAAVNPGNDMTAMMEEYGVGAIVESAELSMLVAAAEDLLNTPELTEARKAGCRQLAQNLFRPGAAAAQIVAGIKRVSARTE